MLGFTLSIFLIPLIIIFNSFFIGKLIYRYSISINPYMTTVMGFLTYISILFIFFSLLYTSGAVILTFLIFFISIQGLLLSLYIWNFRYAFTTIHLQLKSLLLFLSLTLVSVALLVIIILLAYHTQPISNEMQDLLNKFNGHFKQYQDSVIFYDNDKFTFENFSIFNVLACIFKPVFNIADNNLSDYLFWQHVITFGIIFSCAITGFFYQKVNNGNLIFVPIILLISLIIFIFSFMFFECPMIGYSWICIPIIFYCYQTFQYPYHDDRLINNMLLVIVISTAALSVDLTLITTLLLIFNFCHSSYKNLNPFGQSLYCIFPFFYVFFLWMPLSSFIPYVISLTIWLISSLVIILLYSSYVFRKIIMNINKLAYRHPLFIVLFITAIIYTLSVFFFITIFNYHFSWRLWPENYNYIWGIDMKKYPNFNLFFNVGSWIILCLLLITIIVTSIIKKIHFNTQPYLFLISLMILLFINPLTLNLFLKITEQNHFVLLDLGIINFLIIVPITLWFIETIINKPMFTNPRKLNV